MEERYIGLAPRKPKDMSSAQWQAFCSTMTGDPQCIRLTQGLCQKPCSLQPDGIHYILQYDHILARANGGLTSAENMQPVCDIENAKKQDKPDRYWETGQFFFDMEPDHNRLRKGQIEWAWKPALALAEAMLGQNPDIYHVFFVLWWIVGGGKTISMPVVCSAINYIVLNKGRKGTPRINKLLILAKESALRDSIAGELKEELVKFGIYTRAPEVRIITNGDQWDQSGYIDRADIVVACMQQLWETEREEPRSDEQTAKILSRFPAVAADECHFGHGQLERLGRLSPKSLKFGFSNTPINDLGKILDKFVLFSMLDYDFGKDVDDSLKTLHPFDVGVEDGFYVEVKPETHRTMVRGIEGDEQEGLHGDKASSWVWWNVSKAVIKRIQELDNRGRLSSPNDWFSSHGLIRAETVSDAQTLLKMINTFFDNHRDIFPERDGWRACLIHGSMKKGPPNERRLSHPTEGRSPLVHPWMRAKKLDKRRCDSSCARILIAVDMAREGINNSLCNVIGWTCPSVSLIELIQRIGRAMRAVPNMDRTILLRQQSVHLFWHEEHKENGRYIKKAIEWMLDMSSSAEEITKLEDFLEDGKIKDGIQKGAIDSILTPVDKSGLENAAGKLILTGVVGSDIDIDLVLSGGEASPHPFTGERKKRAREFVKNAISQKSTRAHRVGVQHRIEPISLTCYEKPKEVYSDEELINHIDVGMPDLSEESKLDIKKNIKMLKSVREMVENHKRKYDTLFATATPQATQSIVGKGGVIPSISHMFAKRIKGIVLPESCKVANSGNEHEDRERLERAEGNFLIPYVTKAAWVILGTTELYNGGYFDRIEYHTALRRTKIEQAMFELVRLQLMIDGHLPTVRALYEDEVESRIRDGLTLSDFVLEIGASFDDGNAKKETA